MTDHVPGGCVLWAKKIFQSAIWKRNPQYFRVFFWIVGSANFEDGYTFKGHVLLRGQLITTYAAIADALSYCFNRAIIKPSIKEIRIILSWLQAEGMISVKPLIDGTLTNKGRHHDLTRAYVGLLISIVNYDTYQRAESYKGRDKDRPSVEQGQLRKRNKIKPFLPDSVEFRLSELLLEKILYRIPGFKKPNIQTWAKDIDLMIRIDNRAPDDIREVISWCQTDSFWQRNILSTGKLRKQYDQLRANMGENSRPGSVFRPVSQDAFKCPRCSRRIVVKADLTNGGCVYCEFEHKEVTA